jgi:protein TonB
MLGRLLESAAQRPRREAGLVMAVVVHVALATLALRARPHAALASARPEAVALRAPLVPRPVERTAAAGSRAGGPVAPTASPTPIPDLAFVDVPVGVPPVALGAEPGAAFGAGTAVAVAGPGGSEGRGAAVGMDDAPFEREQVERPAMALAGNAAPVYPEALRRAGLDGEVVVQFVVDTLGRAEPGTLQVLRTTHPSLADAVAAVLPRWRFVPAEAGGRRVRMLVRQPVAFGLAR